MFRFYMRYTDKDPTGYYITRWDRAIPIEVIANTQKEADEKVSNVIGKPGLGRTWIIKTDKIVEEVEDD